MELLCNKCTEWNKKCVDNKNSWEYEFDILCFDIEVWSDVWGNASSGITGPQELNEVVIKDKSDLLTYK